MATITPPTPPSDRIQSGPAPETPAVHTPLAGAAPRRVWQVPLFLAGVTTCALVVGLRSFGGDSARRQVDRELADVRHILGRSDGDGTIAVQHARRAMELSEKAPKRKGEALFLLGSAEVRVAEQANAAEAVEWWKTA